MKWPVAPILVLGLGNDLLKDDAVGIRVAEKLQGEFPEEVDVRVTAEFGLALLDELAGRQHALLIDSYVPADFAKAQIEDFKMEEVGEASAPTPHFFGLAEIRSVMESFEMAFPREVRVLAVPVEDPLTVSAEMSPGVAGLVDEAAARARRIVGEWLAVPSIRAVE
jgi:hydrogenase maturation protease